jgi:TolB-like protein/DNA-binding winged helix-turn-helix (wHTH) protein/Tfp pilus assembly protein PilF
MIYVFGDGELDTSLYTLKRAGNTIRLRPKVFRVCRYLLEHRERVVSREELCAQVWPGQFISQATLEGVIRAVRQAVGDSGQTQGIIQTLHGYGYRFVADVQERAPKQKGEEPPPAPALIALPEASASGQDDAATSPFMSNQEPHGTPLPKRTAGTGHHALSHNGHHSESGTPPAPEEPLADHDPVRSAEQGSPIIPPGKRLTSLQQSPHTLQAARAVLALALVTLIILGGWRLWSTGPTEQPLPSNNNRLAVLPFVNLSAEADNTYFVDGITEELIAQLSQIRGLTVISRTSVMKYKGTQKDVATIGRELKVGMILEGSVRKAENHVRISAQLIDVATEGHLWSQEYDRELKGVFAIQSDIANRVAQWLKVQLTPGEKQRIEEQGTANLEAYTLYLQARYFRNKWTEEGLRNAITHFEQAIARDPNYALAYAGIADAYLILPFVAATVRPTEVYPRATAAMEQAMTQGNLFATVHTTMASAKLWYAWDWVGAEAAFRQALALSPNDAATHRRYAWYLITMGRLQDAIAVMHRAQELSPVSPGISRHVGMAFYFAHQYDRAVAQFRATIDMDPTFRAAYSGLVYAYLQQWRYAEALEICQQMLQRWGRDPWILWDLGYASAVSGLHDQARQVLAELHERAQHGYVRSLAFAWVSIGLGQKAQAFAWLEKAYEEHEPYLTLLHADPVYDSLRADPRFTALSQKIGLGK